MESSLPAVRTRGPRPPNLGDGVHYQAFGTPGGEYKSVCRAATVTEVGQWITEKEYIDDGRRVLHQIWEPDAVALMVANPTGLFLNGCIRRDETLSGRAGGTWHLPELCRTRPAAE